MDYTISRALPTDALQLKAIAVAAKAHWGYQAEWLERWATLFQVTEEALAHQQAYKAIANAAIIGWHAVIVGQPVAVLDDLWVTPACMGKGVGRALFEHARHIAQQQGAVRLAIEADPYAVGFYQHMGATIVGEIQSAMGRMLPLMEVRL